jgi:hypothetical protein
MSNNLKAISTTETELRVGNYIILFGGNDLVGERFSAKTLLESSYTKSSFLHVDFEHGIDPDDMGMDKNEILGFVDWKTAKIDERGVFVERVLNRRARYMEYIEPLIAEGLVGNSSEAVAGKTKVSDNGDITEWPLMRDTLTVNPCEPRMLSQNSISAMKSLNIDFADKEDNLKTLSESKSLKDIEKTIRKSFGLSQTEATAIVSAVKNVLHSDCDKTEKEVEMKNILENFKL